VRKSLHTIAGSIRRRDEPVKTILAALSGLLAAGVFAIVGDSLIISLAGDGFRDQSTNGAVVMLISLLWTACSVVLGGYVVARLHNTRRTLSAFMVLELFFGAGMVAEFWTPDAMLWDAIAVLLVIPCAVLGATLAPPRGLKWVTRSVG
jgi:hypothetical protein